MTSRVDYTLFQYYWFCLESICYLFLKFGASEWDYYGWQLLIVRNFCWSIMLALVRVMRTMKSPQMRLIGAGTKKWVFSKHRKPTPFWYSMLANWQRTKNERRRVECCCTHVNAVRDGSFRWQKRLILGLIIILHDAVSTAEERVDTPDGQHPIMATILSPIINHAMQ